jgi:hypothetical protein
MTRCNPGASLETRPPAKAGVNPAAVPPRTEESHAISKLGTRTEFSYGVHRFGHAQDAQSWCKSKWGADDEKAAANHLTPQLALEAAIENAS